MVAVPAFTAVTTPPSTVATSSLSDVQVTVWSVTLLGVTVATSVSVSPSVSAKVSLSSEMPVISILSKSNSSITINYSMELYSYKISNVL